MEIWVWLKLWSFWINDLKVPYYINHYSKASLTSRKSIAESLTDEVTYQLNWCAKQPGISNNITECILELTSHIGVCQLLLGSISCLTLFREKTFTGLSSQLQLSSFSNDIDWHFVWFGLSIAANRPKYATLLESTYIIYLSFGLWHDWIK